MKTRTCVNCEGKRESEGESKIAIAGEEKKKREKRKEEE